MIPVSNDTIQQFSNAMLGLLLSATTVGTIVGLAAWLGRRK